MVALKMEDLKHFTAGLFVGDVFDGWLVREVNIVTFNTFAIDGRIRQGYYSERELEENKIEELSTWKVLKPICYMLIKGNVPGPKRGLVIIRSAVKGTPAVAAKDLISYSEEAKEEE